MSEKSKSDRTKTPLCCTCEERNNCKINEPYSFCSKVRAVMNESAEHKIWLEQDSLVNLDMPVWEGY